MDGHSSLCAAPDHARPSSYGGLSSSSGGAAADTHLSHCAGPGPGSLAAAEGDAAAAAVVSGGGVPDREAALALYRAGPGAGRAQVLNDNHGRLKAAKRKRQLLAEQLNGLKAEVGRGVRGGARCFSARYLAASHIWPADWHVPFCRDTVSALVANVADKVVCLLACVLPCTAGRPGAAAGGAQAATTAAGHSSGGSNGDGRAAAGAGAAAVVGSPGSSAGGT